VVVFGAGCGGTCDLRTFELQDGSRLVMEEHASNFRAFGQGAGRVDLSDVVVAGTGRFAGAGGSATGEATFAFAGGAVVTLSGTVTF